MTLLVRVFTPGKSRRLNELIGFLVVVCATLLLLALASYSPLDPSLNTAGLLGARSAHNWIGLFGAVASDLLLQSAGICAFLLPVMVALLGTRWFRSRPVASPGAKCLGGAILMTFSPALLAVQPWHPLWKRAIPIEGLTGHIVGALMLRYFNLVGSYIVCAAVIAVALYLSTAFSIGSAHVWVQTRFAFVFALWQRFQDWRAARAAGRTKKKMDRRTGADRRAAQTIPVKEPSLAQAAVANQAGLALEEAALNKVAASAIAPSIESMAAAATGEPAIGARADLAVKPKTVLPKVAGGYKLPPTSLLHRPDGPQAVDGTELKVLAEVLTEKCAEFDVLGAVTQINPGPVVTTFEFKPEAGVKYSRVTSLCDDLCLALRAESILIERMPGKSTVGIQVPNHERETIWLREVMESQEFIGGKSRLTLAMGKDINGRIVTADLPAMPHLLIAGSTGSGKSVAINAMIMSILYKSTPDQVRLILVDPKRLELGVYEGVPHLYVPIITEPKLAANALRNAVREMERRLKLLAEKGVRNIEQYNKLFEHDTPGLFDDEDDHHKALPYIVIIIDELADLMMLDQSNVEEAITRLAQMARAVGIHLVLATQRPSVDVITGLIKANFPSRISFRVATKIDSRTILDCNGAESLLGKGDMLYLPSGSARVHRLHAPFTTEKETHAVVEFWRSQAQAQYEQKFLEAPKDEKSGSTDSSGDGGDSGDSEHDDLYQDAVRLVIEFGKASTSLLQRRLRIGYGRAAHLIDLMEKDGIVGAADGPKPREVLKRPDWLSEVEESLR
jgi:S-DNA-T family DNA segregation ATPase FtsK/SpoIIIE